MLEFYPAIFVGIAGIGIFFISRKISRSARSYRQSNALVTIRQLKRLIAFVQKHRGTCATYIQGNHDAHSSIVEIRHEISQHIALLKSSTQVTQHSSWKGFIDHWSRLESKAVDLDLLSSFEQHTNMIQNLLFLFEGIAEEYRFTKSFLTQFPDIALLWRELPLTVEFIGQARAVGVAVSTTGYCSQVDKIKLGYLHRKISQLTRIVLQHLKNNAVMDREAMAAVKLAEQSCGLLIDTINQELLHTEVPAISPQQYFAIASKAMDATNEVIELQLTEVEKSLAN